MSDREDLSALDGNALVARLAVVVERLLARSREQGLSEEELDTEAVLGQCGVRLLGPKPWTPPSEVERLRGLIRMVRDILTEKMVHSCPLCGITFANRAPESSAVWEELHAEECPYPALVAEAEKP